MLNLTFYAFLRHKIGHIWKLWCNSAACQIMFASEWRFTALQFIILPVHSVHSVQGSQAWSKVSPLYPDASSISFLHLAVGRLCSRQSSSLQFPVCHPEAALSEASSVLWVGGRGEIRRWIFDFLWMDGFRPLKVLKNTFLKKCP